MSETMGGRAIRRASVLVLALAMVFGACVLALHPDFGGATLAYAASAREVEYSKQWDHDAVPGETYWISDRGQAWLYDPDTYDSEEVEYRLTKVEVVSGGEFLEEFAAYPEDEEQAGGWSYTTRDKGTTTFKVTYEKLEGGTDSYTFSVSTKSGAIDLDCHATNASGSLNTFPGGSIPLTASAVFRQRGKDDVYDGITYTWEIVEDEGSEQCATISSTTNADGSSSAIVTFDDSSDDYVYYSAEVHVTAKKNDAESHRYLWLSASQDYSEVWFKETNSCTIDPDSVSVNDSITLTPEVRHFVRGTDGYELRELSTLNWSFNNGEVTITDANGVAVAPGEDVAPGTFTITRLEDYDIDITVNAEWADPDADPEWGNPTSWSNATIDLASCRQEIAFYEYDSGHCVTGSDSSVTLTLGAEGLPRGTTIEWKAGLFEDDWVDGHVFTEGKEYTCDGRTITFNGAEALKHLKTMDDSGNRHGVDVNVYAQAKAPDGSIVDETWGWLYFSEPGEEYEVEEDCDLLLDGDGCVSDSGWATVWNEEDPYGTTSMYQVLDVQIVSGADVIDLVKQTDEDYTQWTYSAKKLGTATLKVTYEKLDGATTSYTFKVNVVDSSYSFEPNREKMAAAGYLGNRLLPGDKAELWLQGWRHSVIKQDDGNGNWHYEYEDSTDGLEYRWSLQEGEGLATMVVDKSDPTHVTITANKPPEGQEQAQGYVIATCELYSGGKKVARSGWELNISSEFYAVTPAILDNLGLYESVTIDPTMVRCFLDDKGEPAKEEVPASEVGFTWYYNDGCWRITDGTGAEVESYDWDEDPALSTGPFTITRLSAAGDMLELGAHMGEGDDAVSAWAGYYMDDAEMEGISFDSRVYAVTEGEPVVLKLDLSEFAAVPADVRTVDLHMGTNWSYEYGGFEKELPASAYTVQKADDCWTITVPYESVKAFADEASVLKVDVHAELLVGEYQSFTADAYLDLLAHNPTPFFLDADPTDDKNHGAEVDWMGRMGISTGWEVTGGREFRGMDNVKRCDFAAFLYRMADLRDNGERDDSIALTAKQIETTLKGVSDCSPEKTAHPMEVAWMINSGISKGWPDKGKKTVSFKPMANVARQDMAAFLYRFADLDDDQQQNQSLKPGSEKVAFKDVKHGDEANHASEVEWLASVGVTKGWKSGDKFEFRGTNTVARQDMAAFMYRLYTYMSA